MESPKIIAEAAPFFRRAEYTRLCASLANPGWVSDGSVQHRGASGGSPCYAWTERAPGSAADLTGLPCCRQRETQSSFRLSIAAAVQEQEHDKRKRRG
ncbi:MAG: hypothetical protein BWX48_00115 [Verrucomicrobia bacterium ADurb.Bin006]|jgi:hypothetical protein|nr:MAG: hypothetical protein BWX48_00115 [Verrucomicrobia bacterium ADurb.Bin006]